jgi:hypothetical protein
MPTDIMHAVSAPFGVQHVERIAQQLKAFTPA